MNEKQFNPFADPIFNRSKEYMIKLEKAVRERKIIKDGGLYYIPAKDQQQQNKADKEQTNKI